MGKEILKLLTVVALVMGTLGSCKKEAGLKYSCDENIHQFVSQHLDSWEGITLERINMYGIDTQRAIFNAISDENKAELWRAKMEYIKATETLSPDMETHLDILRDMITPDIYSDSMLADAVVLYVNDHVKSLIANDTLITYYLYTLFTYEPFGEFMNNFYEQSTPLDAKKNCHCTTESIFDCPLVSFHKCNSGADCDPTSWGCGFGWVWPCNGRCE